LRVSYPGVMMKPNTTNNPSFIEPMKALPVEKLPEGDWVYEIKFDGYEHYRLRRAKMYAWSRAIKRRSTIRNCLPP